MVQNVCVPEGPRVNIEPKTHYRGDIPCQPTQPQHLFNVLFHPTYHGRIYTKRKRGSQTSHRASFGKVSFATLYVYC